MTLFNYKITTTNSRAEGSVEAATEDEAKQILVQQYVPEDHGFVDEGGKALAHELVLVELVDLTPPEE
jgi:hypothetical protein